MQSLIITSCQNLIQPEILTSHLQNCITGKDNTLNAGNAQCAMRIHSFVMRIIALVCCSIAPSPPPQQKSIYSTKSILYYNVCTMFIIGIVNTMYNIVHTSPPTVTSNNHNVSSSYVQCTFPLTMYSYIVQCSIDKVVCIRSKDFH